MNKCYIAHIHKSVGNRQTNDYFVCNTLGYLRMWVVDELVNNDLIQYWNEHGIDFNIYIVDGNTTTISLNNAVKIVPGTVTSLFTVKSDTYEDTVDTKGYRAIINYADVPIIFGNTRESTDFLGMPLVYGLNRK